MDSSIWLGTAIRELRSVDDRTAGVEGLQAQIGIGPEFDSEYEYEQFLGLGWFGPARPFPDGEDAMEGFLGKQYTLKVTPVLRGIIHKVTKLGMKTDPRGVLAPRAQKMRESMLKAECIDVANSLGGGFSNTLAADGVALFSASHTTPQGGSYSNLGTAATLSYNSLVDLFNVITEQKDWAGARFDNTEGFYLVFPTQLEIRAMTIIRSTQVAGTTNNDANVLPALRGLEPKRLAYLGDSPAGNTGYFLIPKKKELSGFRKVNQLQLTENATVGNMGEMIMSYQKSWAIGWLDGYNIAGNAGA